MRKEMKTRRKTFATRVQRKQKCSEEFKDAKNEIMIENLLEKESDNDSKGRPLHNKTRTSNDTFE